MGIRSESITDRRSPAVASAAGLGKLCALTSVLVIALLEPAAAQATVAGSELAGVTFPQASDIWVPDAGRSQAAALEEASLLVDRACGPTEFHIWDAIGGERDSVRMLTDTAFAEAGWSLGVINLAPDGERIYLATRGTNELVMVWLPQSEAIGLVLCVVAGPRTAGFAAGAVPDPLQQFMPLPRPRPDPNAPLVEPVPEPDPVAVDPPIEAAAIAEAAVEGDPVDDVDGSAVEVADVAIAEVEPADGASTVSIWLLLLAVAFAIGSFFLLRWGRISARAIAGAAWPSTLAAVVYSNVASETQRDRRGKEIVRFVPVVAYEYEIGGVTYRAARMRFGESSTADATAAKKIADRFPVGAGIEIRYNPNTPGDATIEADPDRLEFRMIGGIALAVLAVAALLTAIG